MLSFFGCLRKFRAIGCEKNEGRAGRGNGNLAYMYINLIHVGFLLHDVQVKSGI